MAKFEIRRFNLKTRNIFAFILAIAISSASITSCRKVEKILPNQEGIWIGISSRLQTWINGSSSQDTILNSGLTGFHFYDDGTVIYLDENQVPLDTVNWMADEDGNSISFSQIGAPADSIVRNIINISKNSLILSMTWSDSIGPDLYKWQAESELQRLKE